jgi:hypothetical protein
MILGPSIQSLPDVISVRSACAFNRKASDCKPWRWSDESAKADRSTAADDGELSERARRIKRLKNSFLSGSKMANVEDAVHLTTRVSSVKSYDC